MSTEKDNGESNENQDPLQEAIDAYYSNGKNKTAAALDLGLARSTFRDRLDQANRKDYKPSNEAKLPKNHILNGTSTLYDSKGEQRLQWIKTSRKYEKEKAALIAMADTLAKDIKPVKATKPPKFCLKELLSLYVITDFHLGMLAWHREGGDNWNTDIASELLMNWFNTAIHYTPDSEVGFLCVLGDFLHYDGLEPVTPTSGHVLDADTRFVKLAETSVELLRQVVRLLLRKHKKVHILIAEGNHDIASSVWLRTFMKVLYEKESRVSVDTTAIPFYGYQWGDTSLFFHHGHKAALSKITEIMADQYREIYGSTRHSYIHLGDKHHFKGEENNMMRVVQHPTLAARDAYAVRGGYKSKRSASVITYSKKRGLFQEVYISPEMVDDES